MGHGRCHTQAKQKQAKMIKVFQPMLSIAVGVIWTTMTARVSILTLSDWDSFHLQTQIQLTKPPKAWALARMRVVEISEG